LEGIFKIIDPFSISFSFDDRTGENLNIMIEEMKEEEERKIREEEEKKMKEEEEKKIREEEERKIREEELEKAFTFSNEEWNKLGLFKRMSKNKEEFIKTKSEEYFQNHLENMENEIKREGGDEKEEEEREDGDEKEEKERKMKEEKGRRIRDDFVSSSNQLQV